MLLFICHVSEDKQDFVDPLAVALREEFDVWYDKFVLTIGDSLRQKIEEGLSKCDFGVVVLSKAFFAKKKWAQAELDALFALEMQFGKIILPIWKDVTAEDVAKHSALLAGKVAVSSTEGLPRVLEEIRLAIKVSERKRELTALAAATETVKAVEQTVAENVHSEKTLNTREGVSVVLQDLAAVYASVEEVLRAVGDGSNVMKFHCSRPRSSDLLCRTIHWMYLNAALREFGPDFASRAELQVKIFQRKFDDFGQPVGDPRYCAAMTFRCRIPSASNVVWADKHSASTYNAEALAAHLVAEFMRHVKAEIDANQTW